MAAAGTNNRTPEQKEKVQAYSVLALVIIMAILVCAYMVMSKPASVPTAAAPAGTVVLTAAQTALKERQLAAADSQDQMPEQLTPSQTAVKAAQLKSAKVK